ncbi:hypothetical protein [Piscirickettsia salmonis]|nr:hypothetical protein [Piscirickettsia salmonis]QNR80351.1 hypothetical protein ICC15_15835 [Piscirickettsia salmonis]
MLSTPWLAALEGSISHDKVTRFLNKNHFGSKELWSYVIALDQQFLTYYQ